jgi:hypothetical protein
MKLLSQYTDGARHAEVYYSDVKQIYHVKLDTGDSSEFFTEDEAGDWAEDWVLGKPTYNMLGARIENIVDSGTMTLRPVAEKK